MQPSRRRPRTNCTTNCASRLQTFAHGEEPAIEWLEVWGFHLGDLKDRDGAAALGTVLCNALTQLGARPEVILVHRPRVGAMLGNASSQLCIPVMRDVELEELNFAKANMEAYFKGRLNRSETGRCARH